MQRLLATLRRCVTYQTAPAILVFALALIICSSAFSAVQTLRLNGSVSRVVVDHSIELNPQEGLTLEAWVRLDTTVGCQTVLGKDIGTSYWLGLCSGTVASTINGSVESFGNGPDGGISSNEWFHIAMTFDGMERLHYVNGEVVWQQDIMVPFAANTKSLGIGGNGSSDTFPGGLFELDGRLSEVRIWNYARSIEELQRSLYQQITAQEPGLVALFPLEGSVEERFGRLDGMLAGNAGFSFFSSPPTPYDPFRIRPTSSLPTVDGFCGDSAYDNSAAVPTWYRSSDLTASERNPREVRLTANGPFLYVCFPRRTQYNQREFEVRIDTNGQPTFTPDPDDYRFTILSDNSVRTQRGQVGFSGWTTVSNPPGLLATRPLNSEFDDYAEFRIPLDLLPSPESVFSLSVGHSYGAPTQRAGWPSQFGASRPGDWQRAVIDDSPLPRGDSRNPTLLRRDFDYQVGPESSFSVRFDAFDDVDLELVEFFVDGILVELCEFPGTDNTTEQCAHVGSYSPGLHEFQARAFDHAGRIEVDRSRIFQVLVDGQSPEVRIAVAPSEPALGQPFTVLALAQDSVGLERIEISEVLGLGSPSFSRCDFDGETDLRTCSMSMAGLTRPQVLRFQATAFDTEALSTTTNEISVLIGNDGFDTDRDGLSNELEASLCTDAEDPDTDRDGLSDYWETIGIPFVDAETLPLRDYGANPCWRNALLQLDHELGARPSYMFVQTMRNEFRNNGIRLFAEVNSRPDPTAYPVSHIRSEDAVYLEDGGEPYLDPRRLWAFKYGYQRATPGASGASGLFFTVDQLRGSEGMCFSGPRDGLRCRGSFECPDGTCGGFCNSGPDEGSLCSTNDDCTNPDGAFSSCVRSCDPSGAAGPRCDERSREDLNYRLLHEFGHSLGLGHGGSVGTRIASIEGGYVRINSFWEFDNWKPNHVSPMNYLYKAGALCMRAPPVPAPRFYEPEFTNRLTFSGVDLGALDEDQLDESADSDFATALRASDCSHAGSTYFPAIFYSCATEEGQFKVLSDGSKAIARRGRFSEWEFFPENPDTPGIDWNCNGTIETADVASNVDGPGRRSINYWDVNQWVPGGRIQSLTEWDSIPNPTRCQIKYFASCDAPERSCYLWPEAYRDAIPTLDTGKPPIDCRDLILAGRSCPEIDESDFPTTTCPLVDRDEPTSAASFSWPEISQTQGHGPRSFFPQGMPSEEELIGIEEGEGGSTPGDVENCDWVDNDGDGDIDEGCADSDSDGISDVLDNCVSVANADQADRDGTGLGDACQFPTVSSLAGAWDGERNINLTWEGMDAPNIGYVIHRVGARTAVAEYLGLSYPSTQATQFTDTVAIPDDYTYVVRAVNLDGEPGQPSVVTVSANFSEDVFGDSFEGD